MITLVIGLLIVATSMIFWGQINNANIYVAPILGVVFGALYSYSYIEEEELTEHTLQCCIFVISLTVIWEVPTNG
jgi:hypothetical protein